MAQLTAAVPQLVCHSIDVAEKFCTEILNFEVVGKSPDYGILIVRRGDAEIHFWQWDQEETVKTIATNSSCYIRVEGAEELFREFKGNGATFGYELEKKPWGMLEMQVNDPAGNAIRFGEYAGDV